MAFRFQNEQPSLKKICSQNVQVLKWAVLDTVLQVQAGTSKVLLCTMYMLKLCASFLCDSRLSAGLRQSFG